VTSSVPIALAVSEAPVWDLHLEEGDERALARQEISRVGQVFGRSGVRPRAAEVLGRDGTARLLDIGTMLSTHTGADGGIDWPTYWAARGIALIPDVDDRALTAAQVIEYTPRLIAALIAAADPDVERTTRAWNVIDARAGLVSKLRTLAETGLGLGLTRERVRQIQMQTTTELKAVFAKGLVGRSFRVAPMTAASLLAIFSAGPNPSRPVVTDRSVREGLGISAKPDVFETQRLEFLFGLRGVCREHRIGQYAEAVWIDDTSEEGRRIAAAVARVHELLTCTLLDGASDFDIVIEANKRGSLHPIDLGDLPKIIPVLEYSEQLPDGRRRAPRQLLSGSTTVSTSVRRRPASP
jgi:hypothetical protein